MSLVIPVITAAVEVRLRGIDAVWRGSWGCGMGQRVVRFVVFVVVAGALVATLSVLVHLTNYPPDLISPHYPPFADQREDHWLCVRRGQTRGRLT